MTASERIREARSNETRKRLTPAQRRYLGDIVDAGERQYNGRGRRVLDALKAAGLVTYESDLHLHARGDTSWTLTAKPTAAGIEADAQTRASVMEIVERPWYDKTWLSV